MSPRRCYQLYGVLCDRQNRAAVRSALDRIATPLLFTAKYLRLAANPPNGKPSRLLQACNMAQVADMGANSAS
jgi:hypothetical protein